MKWLTRVLLALLVLFVIAQFFQPSMPAPRVDETKTLYHVESVPPNVRAILHRACDDCHSSRTAWPWYARVSPVSWWLAKHVRQGRKEMNVDDWADFKPRRKARKLEEICDQVKEKKMPLESYLPLHPQAKLSDADRGALCQWSSALRMRIIAEHPEAARPAQPQPAQQK
jgi:hypothetical protein